MTLSLSSAIITEKNKLASSGAWILLCEVTLPDTNVIKICRNTEDIVFNSLTYTRFPFELEEISENSKGEIPQVVVRVSNVTRVMGAYAEQYVGLVGCSVRIMLVHSDHLTDVAPIVEHYFDIMSSTIDEKWLSLTLGIPNPYRNRFPRSRILKNFCRYKWFKGVRCQYGGSESTCDRTLARCRELLNSNHFGGFPGAGRRGLYV